jgi:hypothetical protein
MVLNVLQAALQLSWNLATFRLFQSHTFFFSILTANREIII